MRQRHIKRQTQKAVRMEYSRKQQNHKTIKTISLDKAIYVCRATCKYIIFDFNSWLSFQQLGCMLQIKHKIIS